MSDQRRREPLSFVVEGAAVADAANQRGSRGSTEIGPAPQRDPEWSTLMARAQIGDRKAYLRLLGEIAPYLRRLAASRHRDPADIEDAVQDILLTVHAIRHTYDPTRPFGPWIAAVANRRLIDRLRRQGRQRSWETALTAAHETFAADRANRGREISEQNVLRAAIANLPPGQREAINRLKLNELSLKEASAATGMSVAALKVATHRALKNLRKMLSDPREDR